MHNLKEFTIFEPVLNLQTEFREQGYLFIRSFFPIDLIKQVRNRVIHILQLEGWGKSEKEKFLAIEPVRRINSHSFYQCMSRLMQEELLHELSEHPPLNWLLSALLGNPVFCHPQKMVRITYPYSLNPKDLVPPHQDLFYVKGERDTFTAWIPLGDYLPEQGGLQVASRTHKQGLFPTHQNDEGRFGCSAIKEHLTGFLWHKAHYRLGDLLIMHSLTLHRSSINEDEQFRLSLDCRFSSVLGSINENHLLPPYHPHVPCWKVLSHNWSNTNRFLLSSTIQVHKKEKELNEILMTPTRFAE
jgi:hypothetical protein